MKNQQKSIQISGPKGVLKIKPSDKQALKLAMLFEGINREGPLEEITRKYGYRREHFYQVLKAFNKSGMAGIHDEKKGPKSKTKRKPNVVNHIIRHRFLDPEASPEVIAQKLKQKGMKVTIRSVERTITEYGMQKKMLINLTLKKRKELLRSKLQSANEKV